MKSFLIKLLCLSISCSACTKKKSEAEDVDLPRTEPEELLYQANPDIVIGAGVNVNLLAEQGAYAELVKKHYSSLTAENAMKMQSLQPTEGTFNFTNQIIEQIALSKGRKRIHGHTLIWHNGLPQWLKNKEKAALPPNTSRSQQFDTLMRNHIRNVIYHYSNPASAYKDGSGRLLFQSWDVVNEAFDDNGNYRSAENMVNGSDKGSIWHRTVGRDYVQKAFVYSRQAAEEKGHTQLKLFYNDYGHDYSAKKLDSIYKMVMALKEVKVNGKPVIDGIGMQFHINLNTSFNNIRNALVKMASTGLLIHISELDISLNEPGLPFSETAIAQQAQKYKDVALLYRKYVPKEQQWGISLWNVGDKDSWLTFEGGVQVDAACLFDLNYNKKAAFDAFYEGLQMDIPSSY